MATIVGYAYKGKVYTPLGMKALLIKSNRIGRYKFEPRYLNGQRQVEPAISEVIANFVRLCGRDMDAPDTYDSADLPKPVFDDEVTEEEQAMFLSTRHVHATVLHEHDLCLACNPLTDEQVMAGNDGKIPARIVAKFWHDPAFDMMYPWHYAVYAYPFHDPEGEPATIDYGNVSTRRTAEQVVAHVLTHRHECDNPEYQHVRADKR